MEKLDLSVPVPATHIKCRRCGKDMLAKADMCVHCGQVPKRIRVRQFLFVAGTLILLVLLAVGFFMK